MAPCSHGLMLLKHVNRLSEVHFFCDNTWLTIAYKRAYSDDNGERVPFVTMDDLEEIDVSPPAIKRNVVGRKKDESKASKLQFKLTVKRIRSNVVNVVRWGIIAELAQLELDGTLYTLLYNIMLYFCIFVKLTC